MPPKGASTVPERADRSTATLVPADLADSLQAMSRNGYAGSHPGKSMPAFLADQAASAVASDEVIRTQ